MKAFSLIALLTLILFFDSCDPFESVKEELPPATQEGKNTFGCLVNGKVWLPKGNAGGISNLDASYDPTYMGGSLDITSYRISSEIEREYMYLYMSGLTNVGEYDLSDPAIGASTFMTLSPSCDYSRDTSTFRSGSLHITNLDESKKIISGTFDFVLAVPNCDTIRVTSGRFDMKF